MMAANGQIHRSSEGGRHGRWDGVKSGCAIFRALNGLSANQRMSRKRTVNDHRLEHFQYRETFHHFLRRGLRNALGCMVLRFGGYIQLKAANSCRKRD